MRALVAELDIRDPRPIWGLSSYFGVRVLIRAGVVPLGWTWLQPEPGYDVLPVSALLDAAQGFQIPDSLSTTVRDLPEITVVVCTRDRHIALRGCLESLLRLKYPSYEVVVVDNASRGSETRAMAEAYGVRCVLESKPGLDNARNCGARAATHGIVAYTDDDVRVDPDWLHGVAAGFQDSDVACVTGLICPLELETPAQQVFESYGGMGKGFVPRLFDPAVMSPHALISAHAVGVGANMAYRRDLLLSLGGFDPDLDVGTPSGGAGDLDMLHRVLASGHKVRYEPRAMVWHQHRRSLAGLYRQIYNNGRSFGCYLLKIASTGTVPRTAVVRFAARSWIGGWLIGSLMSKSPGRRLALIVTEAWGALHSPTAYVQTFRKFPWQKLISRPDHGSPTAYN